MVPKLIIHGGAGLLESPDFTEKDYEEALRIVLKKSYQILLEKGARQSVLHAIRSMESNPIFNAGYGSRIQKDSEVRMSAAIMDSTNSKFTGVINIKNVEHPIDVANSLVKAKHTVLSGDQATEYARKKKFLYFNPIAAHRLKEHLSKIQGESGTVGAVALDERAKICVATSTGGIGYETPGRVSDSATVAGTYASSSCGVSCTGRGEQIVNYALAAKIVTRVEDGIPLGEAVIKIMKQAQSKKRKLRFGLISLDKYGNIIVGNGYETRVLFCSHDGKKIRTFRDLR
jgi:L-asparaginase